jgi:glutamate formiminotransferase
VKKTKENGNLFFFVLRGLQVYTFVGSPSDVVEAALAASRVAYQLIDMARHKGNTNYII